jgi:DNA-binding LacI/PurR family transcriptional regulator
MPDERSGRETYDTPRVTLADVARRAGVSISVVSRELNRDPALRAREETRRRIQQAAQELGYAPSHAARALRLSRAFAVGLVIPDLTNPIYDPLVRGIEEAADELGYQVFVGRTERLRPGADFLRKLAGEGRVDGFLVQRRDETDLRDFASLADAGSRPVVVINSRWPRRGSVVHDDERAGRMATQHLLDLGHRDIALLGGDVHSHTAKARERGYLQAIHAAAMRKRGRWVLNRPYEPGAGRDALIEMCTASRRRPTAVVVANLDAAIGALGGARELGLKVPEQLSIVAIHDWWIADFTRPRLTTVRMPQFQLGQQAMRLLHARLAGGAALDLTITDPPPMLIERESTGPPPRRLLRARSPGAS